MSNNICFDRVSEAKNILKSGICGTSIRARYELETAAWYLVNKTTYTKTQIKKRLKVTAEDYFKGMPDSYIDKSIDEVISSMKDEQTTKNAENSSSSITIYKKELEYIEMLNHDDTERLAFIFLCVAKMIPYKHIYECNSKLYQLAWKYKYDNENRIVLSKQEKRRVGGSEPTKRVNRLCQMGIIQYSTRINKQSKNKPTASATFCVPILQTQGDIALVIDKPDKDSLVLYYDRYKGYKNIVTCKKCGRPVLRTGRRHKYCNACADLINHHPEKRDL